MKRKSTYILILILTFVLCAPSFVTAEPEPNQQQPQPQQETQPQQQPQQQESNSGTQSDNSSDSGSTNQNSSGGNNDAKKDNSNRSDNNNSTNTQNDSVNNNQNYNNYSQYSNDQTQKKKTGQSKKTVSIIYTGDMHSHLDSVNSMGGSARLKTIINKIKDKYPQSFLLDAGDFSMGTAFQSIFTTEASELKMLGELGYDVAALGDHEFDYGSKGLAKMINVARKAKRVDRKQTTQRDKMTGRLRTITESNQFMPSVVCSNINWSDSFADKDLARDAKHLKKSMDKYGVSDYIVVKKNGVRIAVFGTVDQNARNQMMERNVKWDDEKERARQIVGEIKRNKDADLIVCLSNSSFMSEERSKSNDEEMAEEVEGIDVIISAHESTSYKEPVIHGDTVIVAAGSNSDQIGNLVLRKKNGKFTFKKNKLYKLNKKVDQNYDIKYKVSNYKSLIDSHYFSKYGYSYDEMLASSRFRFEMLDRFKIDREDNGLGNIIADSFVYAVKKAEKKNYEKVDVALVPNAEVRSTFSKGNITTSDAFNVLSLGYGPDGKSGYPLVSAYITGKELKRIAEIDATLSSRNEDVILHTAGLSYNFNDHRLFLNRATDIELMGDNVDPDIDNGKLYRVVAGLHTFDILAAVERRSKGLLAILPKDKEGNEIKNISDHIIKMGKKELKEWYALASYIDSFDGDDVPDKYNGSDGRKNDETSFAPWAIIKQPNNYGVMLAALIMIPIVILIGIILYFRQRKYSRRGYEKNLFGSNAKSRRSLRKSKRMGITKGKRNSY